MLKKEISAKEAVGEGGWMNDSFIRPGVRCEIKPDQMCSALSPCVFRDEFDEKIIMF